MEEKNCPKCKTAVAETYFYCPNCGRKLKEPPADTGIARQIGIYLVCLLLPPLGLWPGVKYLRQPGRKAKIIGGVAIGLTAVSLILTTWITARWVESINQAINAQLKNYQYLY